MARCQRPFLQLTAFSRQIQTREGPCAAPAFFSRYVRRRKRDTISKSVLNGFVYGCMKRGGV
ncbi:hypothetical protein GN244_ATG15294 [Phytophthora infestans]|uniref:Uncharacterized protein n=1 Tax=Phytophthora infestans TaxID=4787 RepID=A0A833ST28_PHYIN|nr:hypothetical protein GN244_ATG15294 [Phytophthora infestans]